MRVDGSSNLAMFDTTKQAQTNTTQELQQEQAKTTQDISKESPFISSSAELSTEKVDKMVKDFEKKLLEEMGYEPKTIAKIKNLSEGYRIELNEEMRKSINSTKTDEALEKDKDYNNKENQEDEDDNLTASQTVATYLHMPTNARFYLQELMA